MLHESFSTVHNQHPDTGSNINNMLSGKMRSGGLARAVMQVLAPASLPSSLKPMPSCQPSLLVCRAAAVEAAGAEKGESPRERRAATPRPGTPRAPRASTPAPRRGDVARRTPEVVPASLIRDDTLILLKSSAKDTGKLSTDILAHPALTSTTAPQNGAEPGKLRIVCLAPGLVGVALESLGFANQRLAEQQADHRLQVSMSVRKPQEVGVFSALDEFRFGAFIFVSRVPVSSVPAMPSVDDITKIGRETQHSRAAGRIQAMIMEKGATACSAVGQEAIVNLFRATMVARTRMLAGRLPYAAEAAERQQQQQQQGAGQSSEAKPPTGERMDFLAVPILQVDKINTMTSLSVLRMQLIKTAPPPARAPTPRPAGSGARAGTPRPGAPTPARGAGSPRPGTPRPGTPRPGTPRPKRTITVEEEEWLAMKSKVEQLMQQNLEILEAARSSLQSSADSSGAQNKA